MKILTPEEVEAFFNGLPDDHVVGYSYDASGCPLAAAYNTLAPEGSPWWVAPTGNDSPWVAIPAQGPSIHLAHIFAVFATKVDEYAGDITARTARDLWAASKRQAWPSHHVS